MLEKTRNLLGTLNVQVHSHIIEKAVESSLVCQFLGCSYHHVAWGSREQEDEKQKRMREEDFDIWECTFINPRVIIDFIFALEINKLYNIKGFFSIYVTECVCVCVLGG